MVAVGAVTLVLLFRMGRRRGLLEAARDGELSSSEFNYLVWVSLAVP